MPSEASAGDVFDALEADMAPLLVETFARRKADGTIGKATIKPPMGDPVEVPDWSGASSLQSRSADLLDMLAESLVLDVELHRLPDRLFPLTDKARITLDSRPGETFAVDEESTRRNGGFITIGLVKVTQVGLARHRRGISS